MIPTWETSASDRRCGVLGPEGKLRGGPLMATSLMEPDRQYQVSNMASAEDGGRRRNHSVRGRNTQKKIEEGKREEEKLGGLTLLTMGIWVSVDGSSFLQLLGPFSGQGIHFVNVGFFCIAIGAVLVLLGFLGCCGAHKESKCLLLTFFSIVLIIFIAEVAAGVVALAYSSFAEGIVRAWATTALQKDYGSDPVVTKIWNTTMTEIKCCGFTNYTDFVGSKFEKENGGSLPPICCWTNSPPCSPQEAKRIAVKGCFRHILETVQKHGNIVGGIAAGIGVLEIAAMIVSMYLYCHLDDKIS